ncbi:hypothetical protein [Botryobacter ruber]|uniref:hypothetical protein n=1 Tax=Botryobacter ruber TaxID=2171629 RepID=UPI000E0C52E5|nr:hypothetical protein [Botryobacter ruber]
MKKTRCIILGLLVLITISCETFTANQSTPETKQEKLQGELMFKLISFGSLYGAPESAIQEYEQIIDSLSREENLPDNYRMFLADHQLQKEYGLLYKPYFHLKVDSAKVMTVWLNEEEYGKIKDFELKRLRQENKKVELSLVGHTIGEGMFECTSVIEVNEVNGITYWKK